MQWIIIMHMKMIGFCEICAITTKEFCCEIKIDTLLRLYLLVVKEEI